MRPLPVALAALLALAFAAQADDSKDKGKIDKSKLVGTWTFVKTDAKSQLPEGATMTTEFTKDGKYNMNVAGKDKSSVFKIGGTYKVEGNKLSTTIKVRDQEKTETVTIKELTDKKLVTTQKTGDKVETFEFKK